MLELNVTQLLNTVNATIDEVKTILDLREINNFDQNDQGSAIGLAFFLGLIMLAQKSMMQNASQHTKSIMKKNDQIIKSKYQGAEGKVIKNNVYYADFYEDLNYEYIEETERGEINLQTGNRKDLSEFSFKNLDYDDYQFEEVGLLDFSKPKPQRNRKRINKEVIHQPLTKRRMQPFQYGIPYQSRPGGKLPKIGLLKLRPRVGTSPFLEGIGSRFDFPTLVVIAGLWFIWQNYLASLVPTTILSDFVASLGRSNEDYNRIKLIQMIQMLNDHFEHEGEDENAEDEETFFSL